MSTLLHEPAKIWEHLWNNADLKDYVLGLLIPVGAFCIFSPFSLIIALPSLGINLLSSKWQMNLVDGFHYPAPIVPFVVVSAVLGAKRLVNWLAPTIRRTCHRVINLSRGVVQFLWGW